MLHVNDANTSLLVSRPDEKNSNTSDNDGLEVVLVYKEKPHKKRISFRTWFLHKIFGVSLSTEMTERILTLGTSWIGVSLLLPGDTLSLPSYLWVQALPAPFNIEPFLGFLILLMGVFSAISILHDGALLSRLFFLSNEVWLWITLAVSVWNGVGFQVPAVGIYFILAFAAAWCMILLFSQFFRRQKANHRYKELPPLMPTR